MYLFSFHYSLLSTRRKSECLADLKFTKSINHKDEFSLLIYVNYNNLICTLLIAREKKSLKES